MSTWNNSSRSSSVTILSIKQDVTHTTHTHTKRDQLFNRLTQHPAVTVSADSRRKNKITITNMWANTHTLLSNERMWRELWAHRRIRRRHLSSQIMAVKYSEFADAEQDEQNWDDQKGIRDKLQVFSETHIHSITSHSCTSTNR